MKLNFAHLWQQSDLSDADVVLKVVEPASVQGSEQGSQSPRTTAIRKVPAHSVILSTSPYLLAQVQRWQQHNSSEDSNNNHHCSSCRPAATLLLDDASQEEAALAVLAALYGATEALKEQLTDVQLLQAVAIADMLQLQQVSNLAVDRLTDIAESSKQLSDAAVQQLLDRAAWQRCLLPLVPSVVSVALDGSSNKDRKHAIQQLLLTVLGDLEAAWADEELRAVLLGMELPAMELLLLSDQLQVSSEDTVMFIAEAYVQALPSDEQKDAQAALAPLVRLPHLSQFWKSSVLLSSEPSTLFLYRLTSKVKQVLSLQLLDRDMSAQAMRDLLPEAPASWFLGKRQIKPVPLDGVKLHWSLPVSQLKRACEQVGPNAGERECVIYSPNSSPPLGGLSYRLKLKCAWSRAGDLEGARVGVYAVPVNAPSGMYSELSFTVTAGTISRSSHTPALKGKASRGWVDFFELGYIRGWSEAVLADKGLPAEGNLLLELHVTQPGHKGHSDSQA